MSTEEFLQKGAEYLRKCEEAVQQLLTEAVAVGNYAAVTRLTSLAVAVNRLALELRSPTSSSEPNILPAKGLEPDEPDKRRGGRHKSSDYPHFLRRGNYLVKVGWSKRKKREYQHRLPREFIDAVVEAVRQAGTEGKVFTSEELLPVTNPRDGTTVPDYQAYVALAWLKQLGLVEQHGRQGYSIRHSADFVGKVASSWQQLPEH